MDKQEPDSNFFPFQENFMYCNACLILLYTTHTLQTHTHAPDLHELGDKAPKFHSPQMKTNKQLNHSTPHLQSPDQFFFSTPTTSLPSPTTHILPPQYRATSIQPCTLNNVYWL